MLVETRATAQEKKRKHAYIYELAVILTKDTAKQ
ncbi:hypothetical protein HNP25_003573 [Arcicella rosea]|uniref:Uncharacterized protein n=1 Tax=Arcicella rosea TaxID=502909 RepID=A0A841EV06_9BACT|nr:hypothetical protein [Arcicella rosea]